MIQFIVSYMHHMAFTVLIKMAILLHDHLPKCQGSYGLTFYEDTVQVNVLIMG